MKKQYCDLCLVCCQYLLVNFVTRITYSRSSLWLVYDWIPAQCSLFKSISLRGFLRKAVFGKVIIGAVKEIIRQSNNVGSVNLSFLFMWFFHSVMTTLQDQEHFVYYIKNFSTDSWGDYSKVLLHVIIWWQITVSILALTTRPSVWRWFGSLSIFVYSGHPSYLSCSSVLYQTTKTNLYFSDYFWNLQHFKIYLWNHTWSCYVCCVVFVSSVANSF